MHLNESKLLIWYLHEGGIYMVQQFQHQSVSVIIDQTSEKKQINRSISINFSFQYIKKLNSHAIKDP
jgi:hypothetical protein